MEHLEKKVAELNVSIHDLPQYLSVRKPFIKIIVQILWEKDKEDMNDRLQAARFNHEEEITKSAEEFKVK